MLLQWIFPFEGQCPYCTWSESLPFMLYKNKNNIHEHFSFNHVMSLVNKIPSPYLPYFFHKANNFLSKWRWTTWTSVSVCDHGELWQWKPFAVQCLINSMLRTAAKVGELLPPGLLMLLKLVQRRSGAVFQSSAVYKAQRSDWQRCFAGPRTPKKLSVLYRIY